ncbi:Propionyl-CoA carboxylase alpha chain [Alphaproteobacteria bacterium]
MSVKKGGLVLYGTSFEMEYSSGFGVLSDIRIDVDMIKKLLIANRGEIACRIIKTAKKMGVQTVAIYSEADSNSMHVKLADEAIYIGPATATLSYLNIPRILNAVKISGADAVHPGYGFLSENVQFAEVMERNGIIFVGPTSEAIRKMGDKIQAKKIAQAAGVSVVPGYMGAIRSEREALKIAGKIGYPIMLKAATGGGGKGIRIVRSKEEMQQAFSSTKNEAKSNFSDERTFIEKYIEKPRHIEIQILADQHGNYICLGERECSIQRHHQKIIEEAPSTFIDEKTRKKMYTQSIALARKVKYFSAGTIEYITDADKNFYFMEMNTRLQVEHPITELITGIDIVEQMLLIANGKKLCLKQKDVRLKGWAIECRICAEDPSCGFLPSTGRISTYQEPAHSPEVRVDSGVYEGGEVSMFYDAMISKLCTYAPTRTECIDKMKYALGEYVIRGVSNNIGFLQAILSSDRFVKGDLSTHFLEEEYKEGFIGAVLNDEKSAVVLSATVFVFLAEQKRAASISGQYRGYQLGIGTRWVVMLDDKKYPVTVRPIDDGYKISFENRRLYITSKWVLGSKLFQCVINGVHYNLQIEFSNSGLELNFMGSTVVSNIFTPRAAELNKFMKKSNRQEIQSNLMANMSGIVTDVKVSVGDAVIKGQFLVILEAMKMENILSSNVDGVVRSIFVQKGQVVAVEEVLIEIEKVQ